MRAFVLGWVVGVILTSTSQPFASFAVEATFTIAPTL
jgi:hypothetical protein